MGQSSMENGKKVNQSGKECASILTERNILGVGSTANLMELESKFCPTEQNIQVIGLKERLTAKASRLYLMELFTMDFGKMENSNKDSATTLMEKPMMGNGWTANLTERVLNLGQMAESMTANGKWASQWVVDRRSILMGRPKMESGRMAPLLSQVENIEIKVFTCRRWNDGTIEKFRNSWKLS